MEENLNTIRKFYNAFKAKDVDTMLTCYHMNVQFSDPAFGKLSSEDTRFMWRMLLANSNDLEISYSNEWADEKTGGAEWVAKYTFGKDRRSVVNKIRAQFYFDKGLILEHNDRFNFWKWSSMALGLPGILLGWSPFLVYKTRKKLKKMLSDFKQNN